MGGAVFPPYSWDWDKGKGEKERYTHLNAEFQRIVRRYNKAFLSEQCKEIEENNRMGKTEISSRKLEIPREHLLQRVDTTDWTDWREYFMLR